MPTALIGCSGFVGGSLQRQARFSELYRSSNANQMRGKSFSICVCSAAPAQKWIANQNPFADRETIDILIDNLTTLSCDIFVLISTVDVFRSPRGVTEDTNIDEEGLYAYGLHRRILERFVESNFSNYLIVRLPGLVGPGLRKNAIFDLHNGNNLHALDSRGVFQFYPMFNLWYDIQIALKERLKLVHLTAEPISLAEASTMGFNKVFDHVLPNPPAMYDMRTCYAELFGGTGHYQYSRRESIQAIRAYAQSEPRTHKVEGTVSK